MIKFDKKQQNELEAFFKKEKMWFPDYVAVKFIAYLLLGSSFFLMMIPDLAWDVLENYSMLVSRYLLYCMGIYLYLSKYLAFKENGKSKPILELIKYLPISKEQLCLFCLKKIAKPCILVTVMVIFFRIVLSLASFYTVSIFDVLLPLVFYLMIPFILVLMELL